MRNLIIILIIALFIPVISCKHAVIVQYDCTGMTPGYTADVKPILDANCATSGCHTGSKPSAGINLSDYTEASAASSNNNFLGSIQQLSGYHKMPRKADKLPDDQIKILTCWVQSGSPL